jgi:hypothetical protein
MKLIKGLFATVAVAMGSAAYLVFMALVIFSLPLNVIALMHWYDMEWWKALVTASALGFIPIIGQIGYVVLTVVGAYYFVDAGFDWKMATHPASKELSISELTDEQFDTFRNGLVPVIENRCKDDTQRRFGKSGSLPVGMSGFCTCYAQTAVSIFTRADYVFQESHAGDTPSETLDRFKSAVQARCFSEVRVN